MRSALQLMGVLVALAGGAGPALAQERDAPRVAPSPALPPPAARADAPLFVLRGVRLTGDTVLGAEAVAGVAAPYLGRPVTLQDIEEIRRQVTLLYIDRGYISSGALIPDQTVGDGILTLQAVEGRVSGIALTGNRHYRTSYLTDRLERGLSVPFNVDDLARQQQILLQGPFLSRLNLAVEPGLVPGEARLVGEVTELPPYVLTAQVANDQSPTVGGVRGQVQGVVGNLLGVGDLLTMQYGRSGGTNDGAVGYSVPVASDDTRVNIRYDANNTLVVTRELAELGIGSRYDSLAVGLSRPFYRTAEQNLTLGLSLDWRRSRTFLLDEPFSFVSGAENGNANVTALRFSQDWLDRNAERVTALRSTFSLGVNALGATVSPTPPTGRFFAWLGQAQHVRRVFGEAELVVRGNLQLSADPLLPLEQFPLGGPATVRGYRAYLTATDNAATGSVELRMPVGRVPLPWVSRGPADGIVQVAPFYDHGVGWNTRRPTPSPSDMASVGVALRWLIGAGLAVELSYGYPLRPARAGTTLQDLGWNFRITAGLF